MGGRLTPELSFSPVVEADFEGLADLRARALKPSLEALGRFDPARARERLRDAFSPPHMQHVLWHGERVGLVTVRPVGAATSATTAPLRLHHLYIAPTHQRLGIGLRVMQRVCAQADHRGAALQLNVLKQSPAQRFYARLGFVVTGESEWDVDMARAAGTDPLQLLREAWACIQARDWDGFGARLAPDVQASWWSSGERFVGREAFVQVQVQYPEGWNLILLDVSLLTDGRVLSLVRVDHPPSSFFCTSMAEVQGGQIVRIDELWATLEEPPAWRAQAERGDWQRFDPIGVAKGVP